MGPANISHATLHQCSLAHLVCCEGLCVPCVAAHQTARTSAYYAQEKAVVQNTSSAELTSMLNKVSFLLYSKPTGTAVASSSCMVICNTLMPLRLLIFTNHNFLCQQMSYLPISDRAAVTACRPKVHSLAANSHANSFCLTIAARRLTTVP